MKKLWPLLLPLALLLPGLTSFPYPASGADYSDLAISHYPNAVFLKQSLLVWRTLPLWSPTILSGYPFAANPLAGLWYPPGWLALLLPLPLGFNLVIALHLLWGGVGMYRLLRAEGLAHEAALLGGLALVAMPKLFAHYGAGHLTLLYAVSWTPWLLFSVAIYRLRDGRQSLNIMPGIILALIFLADVRWAVFAAAAWLAYSLSGRREMPAHNLKPTVICFHLFLQASLAILLAAPLALPLLEYTQRSTRNQLAPGDVLSFSLPPARLLGLIFPDFGGPHEWMLYCGAVILMLALLGAGWNARRARFWLGLAIFSLVFSLGSYLPPLSLLARLPGLDLLRVPSRALFLTAICCAALAAYAVDDLLRAPASARRGRAGLLLLGLAGFALALTGSIWILSGVLPLSFAWGAAFTLAGAVWIGLRLKVRLSSEVWFLGIVGLCLLDWAFVDRSVFTLRPADSVFGDAKAAAKYLAAQPGRFRVYSPSYSLPQHTAARFGLELAGGVDPLQLQTYTAFMGGASRVPGTGYSVTLPPFAGGDPSKDNAAYAPDSALLGNLNVRYILAEYDLPVEGLALSARFGQTRLYENLLTLPRAWLQPPDLPLGAQAHPVELEQWTPNRVELALDVTGTRQLLVLSELAYPGWQVRVDGKQAQLQEVAGLLRGVVLEPGRHQVLFVFRPLSLLAGLILCGSGLLLVGWHALRNHG